MESFYVGPHVLLGYEFAEEGADGHGQEIADDLDVGDDGFVESSVDGLGLIADTEKFESLVDDHKIDTQSAYFILGVDEMFVK